MSCLDAYVKTMLFANCPAFIYLLYSIYIGNHLYAHWANLSLYSSISVLSLILDTHLAGHLVFPLLRGVTEMVSEPKLIEN